MIDSTTYDDHQAKFSTIMIDQLVQNDVLIDLYYFDGDPRTCFSIVGKRQPISLQELAFKHKKHRLLIFSEVSKLFNPFTGNIEAWIEYFYTWNVRGLLTPEPVENWGYQELELSEQFMLFPATPDGLTSYIQSVLHKMHPFELPKETQFPYPEELRLRPLRWIERDAPEVAVIENTLLEIRNYLGAAGYYWLCACAIYPELHWNLTLYLGNKLKMHEGYRLFVTGRLSYLVCLPWFRHGYMPDWLRRLLISTLSQKQESDIRSVIYDLFRSEASSEKASFYFGVAEKHKNTLSKLNKHLYRSSAKSASENSLLKEYVFQTFMSGRKVKSLAVQIPSLLLDQFEEGKNIWPSWLAVNTIGFVIGFFNNMYCGWS